MKNVEFGMRNAEWMRVLATALILGLVGCSEKAAEPDRKTHPTGWAEPASENFHGEWLKQRTTPEGYQTCRNCHGPDSSTAATGVSCFGCHNQYPHPAGWSGPMTANLHQTHLQRTNWNVGACKDCHGQDYRTEKNVGGQMVSCYTCHAAAGGPENCRVCHGGANGAAPPPDLLGGTDEDLITVGAHQQHLNGRSLSDGISCGECHHFPSGFSDPAHIDTSTRGVADLTFGGLATNSGRTDPKWNRTNGGCSSVYCHGSFEGGNDSLVVVWTAGTSQTACGSCHSLPPPDPHPQVESCFACHVYSQENHVNGVVDMR